MKEGRPSLTPEASKPFKATPDAVRNYLSKRMSAVHSKHYDPNTPLSKVAYAVVDVMRGGDKNAAQELAKAVIDGLEDQNKEFGGPGDTLEDLRTRIANDLHEFGISEEVFEAYWSEKYPGNTGA